jgi:hypothetical protein
MAIHPTAGEELVTMKASVCPPWLRAMLLRAAACARGLSGWLIVGLQLLVRCELADLDLASRFGMCFAQIPKKSNL